MVILHPVPQDQVLRSRRRPNRIRLHKLHPLERPLQRRGHKQALGHRQPPQVVKVEWHPEILPKAEREPCGNSRPRLSAGQSSAARALHRIPQCRTFTPQSPGLRPVSANLRCKSLAICCDPTAIAITSHRLSVSTNPADRSDLFTSIIPQGKELQSVHESIYLSFGCVEIQ